MVKIQAHTMRPATPHLTALSLLSESTPMMAPVMVYVVLTGMPRAVVTNREIMNGAMVCSCYACFTMMDSITCATSSQMSRTVSANWKISFHLMSW
jgi:hypothetical protein